MAEPKKRLSATRSGNRRSHLALKTQSTSRCSHCGKAIVAHRVCTHCGYYKGQLVVPNKAKK